MILSTGQKLTDGTFFLLGFCLSLIPAERKGIILLLSSLIFAGLAGVFSAYPEWGQSVTQELVHYWKSSSLDSSYITSLPLTLWALTLDRVPKWTHWSDRTRVKVPKFNPLQTTELQPRLAALEDTLKKILSHLTISEESQSHQISSIAKSAHENLEKLKGRISHQLDDFTQTLEKKRQMAEKDVVSLQRKLNQVESNGLSSLKSLEIQLKELDGKVANKLSESSVKTLEKRYRDLAKEIQGLSQRLEKMELSKAEAQPAYDQGTLEEQVRAALDHLLPPLLLGKVDKISGKVELHPQFWEFLSQNFISESNLTSTLKKALSKEVETIKQDFLVRNSEAVAQMSKAAVNEMVETHILVTKDSVVKLIEDELRGLSAPNATFEDKIKAVAEKAVSDWTSSTTSPIATRVLNKNTEYPSRDFALLSLGTRVVPSKTSLTFSIPYRSTLLKWASKLFKVEQRVNLKGPETAMDPSLSPGQCWAMAGSRGKLTLEFLKPVTLDGLGIEHVSPEEVQSITSAMKDFQIWAYPSSVQGNKKELLGEFRFDPLRSSGRMTFDLPAGMDESRKWKQIELLVLTNWGHSEYTCLYKVKVFGH